MKITTKVSRGLIAAAVSVAVTATGLATMPASASDVSTGLVAWYKLDETSGVNLTLTPERVAQVAEEAGITFCFAQASHPAMRHAAAARAGRVAHGTPEQPRAGRAHAQARSRAGARARAGVRRRKGGRRSRREGQAMGIAPAEPPPRRGRPRPQPAQCPPRRATRCHTRCCRTADHSIAAPRDQARRALAAMTPNGRPPVPCRLW